MATGNCAADVEGDGEGFTDGLFAATREVARVDPDFREATRGVAVGEGTATDWPGLVTSEVLVAGAGSGS